MKDGWLCDSILNTAQRPSPISTAPAFSQVPATLAARSSGVLQMDARALVGTVLAPHCGEHTQLGPVGFTSENAENFLYSSSLSLCCSRMAMSQQRLSPLHMLKDRVTASPASRHIRRPIRPEPACSVTRTCRTHSTWTGKSTVRLRCPGSFLRFVPMRHHSQHISIGIHDTG